MSQQYATFLFIGVVGLAVLGMSTFLISIKSIDGSVFNTLAGTLLGGIVGLLAPSPIAVGKPPTP
jgi:hypothetical protein